MKINIEELRKLIIKERPTSVGINRKMYQKLFKELSDIQGSFKGILIRIDDINIYAMPDLADDVVEVIHGLKK